MEHRPGPTGSPRLEGVLATLECTVEHSLPGGDHEIIIGRLRYAETSADDASPLLFWRGSYTSLDETGVIPAARRTGSQRGGHERRR